MIVRISKLLLVGAMALFATLVSFGNITDYNTNFVFVQHVLSMDAFSAGDLQYRAISSPTLHKVAYLFIIACETLTAVFCWLGFYRLLVNLSRSAAQFNRAKCFAVIGLTLGFLVWQVGFMSIGGEWFDMWRASQWDGVTNAFHFFVTLLLVLIYLNQKDDELAA